MVEITYKVVFRIPDVYEGLFRNSIARGIFDLIGKKIKTFNGEMMLATTSKAKLYRVKLEDDNYLTYDENDGSKSKALTYTRGNAILKATRFNGLVEVAKDDPKFRTKNSIL